MVLYVGSSASIESSSFTGNSAADSVRAHSLAPSLVECPYERSRNESDSRGGRSSVTRAGEMMMRLSERCNEVARLYVDIVNKSEANCRDETSEPLPASPASSHYRTNSLVCVSLDVRPSMPG